MTISVDWTGVAANPYRIYVPKVDMTLIEAGPPEIYELDLDVLRLTLRDLEDDPDGRPWPKTHIHDTETTLSGVTYARKIQILAPYTVEFENAMYQVNCVGANHNIADRKVVNSVSLIINNSAGLISAGGDITGVKADTEELLARLTITRAAALDDVILLRKIATNRLELADGTGYNWILYDDDSVTPILRFAVSDKSGGAILSPIGIPARRGKGVTP